MTIQRAGIGLNKALIKVSSSSNITKSIKYRCSIKRAPYLSTFNWHDVNTPKYLTHVEERKIGYLKEEDKILLQHTYAQDHLNPNIETNFGRSGRIDAPR